MGGSNFEQPNSIQQTADGEFIVAGWSSSNDSDVSGNHGNADYWIVKLDVGGNMMWQKSLGGSGQDYAQSIQQTADGGFIVAGSSYSDDGDISGNHPGIDGYPSRDYWIVKLDSVGNLTWQKCLGGNDDDQAYSIHQTNDGGFIVAGKSNSNDADVSGNHGSSDYWIVRLDMMGNLLWQKCLGGTGSDNAFSLQPTAEGGFIVAGESNSNDADVSGNHGGVYHGDYWVVKIDTVGNLIWQKCLGGSNEDIAFSVQQTNDGGFIVSGYSLSNDDDVSGNNGSNDSWIAKLNTSGSLVWQKSLGGSGPELARSIQQTVDGGFVIAGWTESNDNDVSGNHGSSDYWMVKLDTAGNLIWQKCLGGSNEDGAYDVQQTSDGGFIVAGVSASNDSDVTGNHGSYDYYYGYPITTWDYWIVKLSPEIPTAIASLPTNFISLSPNPVQNLLTINLSSPSALASDETIAVYDMAERKIVLPTTISNNKAQLNTTTLPNGIYIVQVINDKMGVNGAGKFVKQE